MDNAPIILVTGATGAVGPSVVAAVRNAGFRIRTLSLDMPPKGLWPEDVDTRIGDIIDPAVVDSAMMNVEAVIHLAALLHIVNPLPEMQPKYKRVNIEGTDAVVKAAIRGKTKRVVLFSTVAVYGDSRGRVVDESAPPQPRTFYAQTKLAAEQIVLNARDCSGQPFGTVLRLGAVYGSRIKGNYRELVSALAHGRFVPIGHGQNRRTLIYDKDVGRAAALVIFHPAAPGRVFDVTDGEFHTMKDIIESICAALGRRPPLFSVPAGLARFAAGILEDGSRLIGFRSPIARSTIDKYVEDIAVSGNRLREDLGFQSQYDLLTGWKETIQEMRRSHEL
jgi:nucleoside-diphosphate-sugar epimerase